MIPHLKTLIKSSLNQERNWAWHHPGNGHAHLIKKNNLFLLKLIVTFAAVDVLSIVDLDRYINCSFKKAYKHCSISRKILWSIELILLFLFLK